MDRKLINYLPYVVRDYAEFQGITGAEQPEFENAWAAVDDLLNNQFIKTAGNLGLSRWEKILGITPKGTDTLDDRRFRVLTRLNEELPYTLPQLRVILESLCGAGNYSADVADYTLLVKVGVAAKKNFQDVQFPSPRGDKLCLQNCPTGACGIGPGSDRITISHSTATGKWQLEIKIPLIFLREPLQTAMQVAAMETRFAQSADSH